MKSICRKRMPTFRKIDSQAVKNVSVVQPYAFNTDPTVNDTKKYKNL